MAEQTTGTITFLFTDIQDSTMRWEQYPHAMKDALVRHDMIMNEAIQANNGYIFKTLGDAFCVAFPTAVDALSAALTAQRALYTRDWGAVGPLRARMSMHTGTAQERDGDYFGPALNRAARILSAGHGGQILLSGATERQLEDELPPNTSLQDLGERRFKGLDNPERVFQVTTPNLPSKFPPLNSLDQQNRTALRRRTFAVSLTGALVLALAMTGVATARLGKESRAAVVRAAASQAEAQLQRDPELGVLLAMEAVSTSLKAGETPLPEAQTMLHKALQKWSLRMVLGESDNKQSGSVSRGRYHNNSYYYEDGDQSYDPSYSPDGRYIAASIHSDNDIVKIWDTYTGHEYATLHGDIGYSAYTPDGDSIVTISQAGKGKVWDARTGRERLTLEGDIYTFPYQTESSALFPLTSFSPDGRFMLTADSISTKGIWDLHDGKKRLVLKGDSCNDLGAKYSPDGRWIITVTFPDTAPATAKVWDAQTGKERFTLQGHTSIGRANYSPDGRFIITTGNNLYAAKPSDDEKKAIVWDAQTGQQHLILTGNSDVVIGAEYSPDGRRIVTISRDGTAIVWDAETGQERLTMQAQNIGFALYSAEYTRDGRNILIRNHGELSLWDAQTGEMRAALTYPVQSNKMITGVAYSPDGHFVATTASDGKVQIWDAWAAGEGQPILRSPMGNIETARYGPDGHLIVGTVSLFNTALNARDQAKVWNAQNGKELQTIQIGSAQPVTNAGRIGKDMTMYSPDGHFILTTSNPWVAGTDYKGLSGSDPVSSTVSIWDAQSGKEQLTLRGHTSWLFKAAYSPDGRFIATGSGDGTAKIWNALTAQVQITLKVQKEVIAVAYSPDGHFVATGDRDSQILIWDAVTGETHLTLCCNSMSDSSSGAPAGMNDIAYSPDGRFIIAGTSNKTPKVWDAETGQVHLTLRGHTEEVASIAYSPDGRSIATASWDKTAKIWDAQTGEELATLFGNRTGLNSVDYSPDSRYILTASYDGIHQYMARVEDVMAVAARSVTRSLTAEERATYLPKQ